MQRQNRTESHETAQPCIYCDTIAPADWPCCAAAALTAPHPHAPRTVPICGRARHRAIVSDLTDWRCRTTPPATNRFVTVGPGRTLELGRCALCGERLALDLGRVAGGEVSK